MSKPYDVGSLKRGGYVIIDGEPCRIVDITKSKPGKHGSKKARVVAIGVFNDVKRSFVKPVNAQVQVPMIDKRTGQVIAILPKTIQIMDMETYNVFETPKPKKDDKLKLKLASGSEIEYWKIKDKVQIMRVKN